MKLILTHDNADFDAVASLLAAYRLDPTSMPVLPLRVNRNVEHFLNIYGEELPFLQRDDLRRGVTVEHVTVVDTQSFSTARGMHLDTPIHFVDHHPLTREMTDRLRLELQFGQQNFQSMFTTAGRSRFGTLMLDWMFHLHYWLGAGWTLYRGGTQDYDQILLNLGYRF